MKKKEILSIIKSVIKEELQEFASHAPVGNPSNLHGAEESQRAYVMKLAEKNGGLISSSVIAYDLGVTKKQLQKFGYIKRMANDKYRTTEDFDKIVDEVPFQSEAIYKLVGTPPPSDAEIAEFAKKERIAYKNTEGVYYVIQASANLNRSQPVMGWLNLTKNENPEEYFNMVPADSRKDYYFSKKPITKVPKEGQKVITKDEWPAFIQSDLTERKK